MGDDKDEMLSEPTDTIGSHVDSDTIRLMREAGIERPKEVARQSWVQPEQIDKGKYHTIAYLAVRGMNGKEIAESLGLDHMGVNAVLQSERMQFEIKHLTYKLYGKDARKQFQEILPEAIDIGVEVMRDKMAKPAIKFAAAQYFMDRALGKPTQSHEVNTVGFREFFELLEKRQPKTIDATEEVKAETVETVDAKLDENPNERIKPDRKENPNASRDSHSEWVEKNL